MVSLTKELLDIKKDRNKLNNKLSIKEDRIKYIEQELGIQIQEILKSLNNLNILVEYPKIVVSDNETIIVEIKKMSVNKQQLEKIGEKLELNNYRIIPFVNNINQKSLRIIYSC